jgi:hypothetical protein
MDFTIRQSDRWLLELPTAQLVACAAALAWLVQSRLRRGTIRALPCPVRIDFHPDVLLLLLMAYASSQVPSGSGVTKENFL